MPGDKKDATLVNFQKDIKEIKEQLKKIKRNAQRAHAFLLILISVMIVISASLVSLGLSFKNNLEDKLKIITIEYNKVKSLENRFKKFIY